MLEFSLAVQPTEANRAERLVVVFATNARPTQRRVLQNIALPALLSEMQSPSSASASTRLDVTLGKFTVPIDSNAPGWATIELRNEDQAVELARCAVASPSRIRIWVDDESALPIIGKAALTSWLGWERASSPLEADVAWLTAPTAGDISQPEAALPQIHFLTGEPFPTAAPGGERAAFIQIATPQLPFAWPRRGTIFAADKAQHLPQDPGVKRTPWIVWHDASGRALREALVDSTWRPAVGQGAATVRILDSWLQSLSEREALRVLDDVMGTLFPRASHAVSPGVTIDAVVLDPTPRPMNADDGTVIGQTLANESAHIAYRARPRASSAHTGWLGSQPRGSDPVPPPPESSPVVSMNKALHVQANNTQSTLAWWLTAGLVLLLLDTLLYHRGRLP